MSDNLVSVEEVSQVQKRISIFVSPENVDKKFDEFFKGIQKTTEAKGYRKGKAPLSVLKQQYKHKVQDQVAQTILSEQYTKALQEHNIIPLSEPHLEKNQVDKKTNTIGFFKPDNSYFVSLLVEVLPKFKPQSYTGLELQKSNNDAKQIADEKLNDYRKQFATRKQIEDRPAKSGDTAVIDFKGFIDGVPFAGGEASGYSLEIGSGSFVAGFEDQVVGMVVGEEKKIQVKFPSNYQASNLADKDAVFQVQLLSIVETYLAEVDGDLATMTGFNSIEELMESVNKEAVEKAEELNRNNYERQILAQILDKNQFETPKSMIQNEVKRLVGNNKVSQQQAQQLIQVATRNVKRAILLDAIYEVENEVEITPDELDKLLEKYATQNNIKKDDLVSNLYNTNQMDAFMGILRSQKAVDFIISKANIKE